MSTTKAIGFANKYYTAWEISEEIVQKSWGAYKVTHYIYLRNLSFDFETAKSKFNGVFIEGLRGKSKSFETKENIFDPTMFQYGKYRGMKFSEVDDYDYLMWYYNQDPGEKQKENIKKILEQHEYYFDEFLCYDKDKWERKQNRLRADDEAKQRILNNDIDFVATRNLTVGILDESQGFIVENHIIYKFENIQTSWFNGYQYGLPTIKGKGKRIKGKKIVVTKFDIVNINNNEVLVKEFKIEKI